MTRATLDFAQDLVLVFFSVRCEIGLILNSSLSVEQFDKVIHLIYLGGLLKSLFMLALINKGIH